MLVKEIGHGPVHIVLHGDSTPAPTERNTAAPTFRPVSIVAKRSPVSATAELSLPDRYTTPDITAVFTCVP